MIRKETPPFVVSALDLDRGVITVARSNRGDYAAGVAEDLSMPIAITSNLIEPDAAADIFEHFAKRGIAPPVAVWNQLAGDARVIGRMLGELRAYDEELGDVRDVVHERDETILHLLDRVATLERNLIGADNTIRSLVDDNRDLRRGPVVPVVDKRDPMLARMTSEQWSAALRAKVAASKAEQERRAVSVVCDVEWD